MWGEPNNPEWEWAHAFAYGPNDDKVIVFSRCPKCGAFISNNGSVIGNGLGEIRLEGWSCRRCGPIDPDWTRSE